MNPLVSVIIPCYNVEPFILRCLDSIICNTYQDLEIICIDDGSTDNTLHAIRTVCDDRIKVISQENSGVSVARNSGMEASSGEYICFIDADDWVDRLYFESMVLVQQRTKADLVYCNYRRVAGINAKDFRSEDKFSIEIQLITECWNSVVRSFVWGKLFNKKNLASIRFRQGLSFCEDLLFNIEYLVNNPDSRCAKISGHSQMSVAEA